MSASFPRVSLFILSYSGLPAPTRALEIIAAASGKIKERILPNKNSNRFLKGWVEGIRLALFHLKGRLEGVDQLATKTYMQEQKRP